MRGQQPDAGIVTQAEKDVGHTLDVLERALDGRTYLAGEHFTLAEVCFMPYVGYLFAVDEARLVTSRRNVASWWSRLAGRPSWKKVGAQH